MVGATGSNQTAKGASTRNFVFNASTGSLGLGIAPSSKLDVNGDISIRATDSGTQKFTIDFNEATDSLDFNYTP
jgi:hypothetical protein